MRTGYQHVVQDYLVTKTRAFRDERLTQLKAICSRSDAEKYQERVRSVIASAFQPLPQRTPLRAKTTGVVRRRGYSIETVIFESRPQCLVTANLYLPADMSRPLPAVLGSCGHSATGKAHPSYQQFCQRLAQAGFAVLIYDPFSQGERDQHAPLSPRAEVRRNCVAAHNMMGKQLELLGEWFGSWRAWDGIRALDYLLSRPEVDRRRVGMTGNSGGGTMTTWLWPLEPRLTMAAPSCFLTPFLYNLENEMPQDVEQYPPGILGRGVDLADFFLARAPDPVLLLGQKYDFFDRRGFAEICAEVKRFYRFFGAERNVESFLGNHPHGFYPDAQQAMVTFFCKRMGVTKLVKRAALVAEKPETLFAARLGRVASEGSKPAWRIMAERARELAAQRKRLAPARLKERLRTLLRLPALPTAPHHRNLRPIPTAKPAIARYAVETEPNVCVVLTKVLKNPAHAQTLDVEKEVHLYVPHYSSEMELAREPLAQLLATKHPLYLLDVRGFGESLPDEEGSFFQSYGKDYMYHGFSQLLGESYLGRRVHDVLAVMNLLAVEGARRVHLVGRGQGALIALFAGLLHDGATRVTLLNLPRSYQAWVQSPVVDWPAANVLPGVLREMDIADCVRALGSKVRLLQPCGTSMKPRRQR